MKIEPSYLKIYENGELDQRIRALYKILEECTLYPRKCSVNRLKDEKGEIIITSKQYINKNDCFDEIEKIKDKSLLANTVEV